MNSIAKWVAKNCKFAAGLNFDRPIERDRMPLKDRRKIGPAEVIPSGDLYHDKNVQNLPAPNSDPQSFAAHKMLREKLEQVLDTLSHKESEVVRMRYGLGQYKKEYTLKEIAKVFHLDFQDIQRILNKAILKLQHPVRSRKLEGFVEEDEKVERFNEEQAAKTAEENRLWHERRQNLMREQERRRQQKLLTPQTITR